MFTGLIIILYGIPFVSIQMKCTYVLATSSNGLGYNLYRWRKEITLNSVIKSFHSKPKQLHSKHSSTLIKFCAICVYFDCSQTEDCSITMEYVRYYSSYQCCCCFLNRPHKKCRKHFSSSLIIWNWMPCLLRQKIGFSSCCFFPFAKWKE